ncbi:P-loop containing nucleoside triphosphate hydrolase protein [Phanerochaete sordida]|uniref:P-loop containing nucleoside triphosphate hydrolase protein n=1 Tax=Phanerochaete sordida TaxID=48140 RepID=A0A9P3GVM5_9APHY|nr:P-loop containing nucleoside triphosphate hydrolase protein [Phanerochaete sordida]
MRLRTVDPPLPDSLLDALDELGIRTDADFVFAGTPMELYKRLPLGTVSLAQLTAYVGQVVQYSAASGMRADNILRQAAGRGRESRQDECLSGVPELDRLTRGFGGPGVLEISGDRGSGKTALALQVVMRHLSLNPSSGAMWIDTTGDFSVDRVMPVLKILDSHPGAETAAERLQISLAFDIGSIQEILDNFASELETATAGQASRTRLLVIDNMTPIFRPLLSVVSSQGHAMMTSFMRQLRTLARTHALSVLVLNGTSAAPPHNAQSAFKSTVRKPALGPTFTFQTDATLWLAMAPPELTGAAKENGDVHVAEVFRSRTTASRSWCTFRVRGGVLSSAS